MLQVLLKKNEDKRIRSGHLWVFSNEIEKTTGNPCNGDLVEVLDYKEQLLGSGFYNGSSLIAVRLISKSKVESIYDLFSKRIVNANNLRNNFYSHRG
jgi:23S rRNA (cytosine1962-C5)-methyltransferase